MPEEVKMAALSCGRKVLFRRLIKSGLKNIYISVDTDGIVTVKSPNVSDSVVISVLEKKSEWIFRRLLVKRESLNAVTFTDGCLVPLFGSHYPLEIIRSHLFPLGASNVYLAEGKIKAEINPYLFKEEYFFRALDRFWKGKAEELISPIMERRTFEMGLYYKKLTFRKTGSRWGSCSSHGNISLNYELVKLPEKCADYVCVHELAHITHNNHGEAFWKLVEKYVRDYKEIRRYMKNVSID